MLHLRTQAAGHEATANREAMLGNYRTARQHLAIAIGINETLELNADADRCTNRLHSIPVSWESLLQGIAVEPEGSPA